MRTADERKEAICWVLRHARVGDCDDEHLMLPARFIGKLTGLPLWMVFYYTRELIREGVIEARVRRDGSHVYSLPPPERRDERVDPKYLAPWHRKA